MAIEGEALLAAVGVDAIIGDGKLRITAEQRKQAGKWADGSLFAKEIRAFLRGEGFDKPPTPPDFDYHEALDKLTANVDVGHLESKFATNNSDEVMALVMAADAAVAYLNQVLPKRSRTTSLGPIACKPSDYEVYKFARAHALVERPMVMLEALHSGTLSSEQVRAFSTVFPELYQELKKQIFLGLADLKASKGDKFEMPQRKDKLLSILLQAPSVTPELLKDMQAAFQGADETQEKAPTKPLNMNQDSVQTPNQRVEYK